MDAQKEMEERYDNEREVEQILNGPDDDESDKEPEVEQEREKDVEQEGEKMMRRRKRKLAVTVEQEKEKDVEQDVEQEGEMKVKRRKRKLAVTVSRAPVTRSTTDKLPPSKSTRPTQALSAPTRKKKKHAPLSVMAQPRREPSPRPLANLFYAVGKPPWWMPHYHTHRMDVLAKNGGEIKPAVSSPGPRAASESDPPPATTGRRSHAECIPTRPRTR